MIAGGPRRGGEGGVGQDRKQWGDEDAHYVDGCGGFTGVYVSNIIKVTTGICALYCMLVIHQ